MGRAARRAGADLEGPDRQLGITVLGSLLPEEAAVLEGVLVESSNCGVVA